ncbi:MAG: Gfo/Idh/MocA family protein, partial [Planctomycetota bacterium]
MAEPPLRAALAACGGISELTLSAARRSPDFDVVAIQDPDGSALSRVGDRFEIFRRHADFEDLLTDDMDFVVVNSPNHVHLEQVRAAAAAGKPCLVQKPMAPTLADAEEMALVAAEAGLSLGVTMFELGKPLNHQVRQM